MKMSKQSVITIMMALQQSILYQEDIVPVLESLDFTLSDGLLVCLNPPQIDLSKTKDEDLAKAFNELSVEEIEES